MSVFEIIVICLCWLWIAFLLGSISNCKRQSKLIDAIYFYKIDCLNNGEYNKGNLIEFEDIYYLRGIREYLPWNWSYKKILPPGKYEIIKPYLKGQKK